MAKKDNQNRLVIPTDIWNYVDFSKYDNQNFAFFITNDARVAIAHVDLGEKFEYEFIGNCNIDEKHRFVISENIDSCLGYGDTYYFSTSTSQSLIYIQKSNYIDYQQSKEIFISIRNLLSKLDTYLEDKSHD